MKKFPKPLFKDLVDAYKVDASTVHDCPRLYAKDAYGAVSPAWAPGETFNTCAIRITEALVLANRLVDNRAKISALTSRGGNGMSFLLGKYDYKNNLCPHGIGRGARDVAYFLKEHWGKPTHSFTAQAEGAAPADLKDETGIVAFIKIPGYSGQGHMDVWNKSAAVGSAYFDSEKIWFWRLG